MYDTTNPMAPEGKLVIAVHKFMREIDLSFQAIAFPDDLFKDMNTIGFWVRRAIGEGCNRKTGHQPCMCLIAQSEIQYFLDTKVRLILSEARLSE